jgi:hypothetical protein
MWEFLKEVAGGLPAWFLMLLIVFTAGMVVYALPRLRWDKNGKPYLFSRSYEHQKNRVKDLRESIVILGENIRTVNDRVLSVECESLKQSFYLELLPKDERLIAGLKYVYNGGNGPVRKDVGNFVRDNPDVYMDVITRFPQWALAKGEA